jgi:hypothetical protein
LEKILIIGIEAEVNDLALTYADLKIIGIIDPAKKLEVLGIPILEGDEIGLKLISNNKDIGVLIALDSPQLKEKLGQYYKNHLISMI